ncbi:hypothetical protein ACHQM5_005206 [Ranunculus cassubicifolius]
MASLTRGPLIPSLFFTPSQKPISPSPFHSLIIPSNSHSNQSKIQFRVSSSLKSQFQTTPSNPVIQKIQNVSKVLIFTVATALMVGKFSQYPARAETPIVEVQEIEKDSEKEVIDEEEEKIEEKSSLSSFLESNSEAVEELKAVLQTKLDDGEDEEALKILEQLCAAQPLELNWKFLTARLYNEIGERDEAKKVYKEILNIDPLCFDALFQTAVLMDQCGEGEAALQMLEEKLIFAQEEQKETEARNVRLILAQIQYLQKNVDEALRSYEELAKEDPADYRPYFYQFVIYSLLDRNDEAKMLFAKCREVCPKDFKVEAFVQTPLSRVKLFEEANN